MDIKNKDRSISIIGKGIAGLTLAYSLERAGFDNLKIYDQNNTIDQSINGTGLILACNAMTIFKKIGLVEEIEKRGNIIKKINVTDEYLKTISYTDLQYFSKIYGVNSIAIHRKNVYDSINSNIKSESFLGKKLDNINIIEPQLIEMCFEDKTNAHSNIVIGADGIYSKVRDCCFEKPNIRNAKQICWRGIANISIPKYDSELNEIWGKGKRFGFVKISSNKTYWYALINSDKFMHTNLSELNYIYSDFHPTVLEIINNTEENTIVSKQIIDFKTYKKWHADCICLIGDAAHAMTPNLGQGACQAIEDSYTLSECLKRYEMPKVFIEYNKIRYNKALWIVERSRKIGKLSQLNSRFSMLFRNFIMRIMPTIINRVLTKKMLNAKVL